MWNIVQQRTNDFSLILWFFLKILHETFMVTYLHSSPHSTTHPNRLLIRIYCWMLGKYKKNLFKSTANTFSQWRFLWSSILRQKKLINSNGAVSCDTTWTFSWLAYLMCRSFATITASTIWCYECKWGTFSWFGNFMAFFSIRIISIDRLDLFASYLQQIVCMKLRGKMLRIPWEYTDSNTVHWKLRARIVSRRWHFQNIPIWCQNNVYYLHYYAIWDRSKQGPSIHHLGRSKFQRSHDIYTNRQPKNGDDTIELPFEVFVFSLCKQNVRDCSHHVECSAVILFLLLLYAGGIDQRQPQQK